MFSFLVFGGFIKTMEQTVNVSVVVGGVAALECDVRVRVPLPTIEWSDSAGTTFTDEQFLEGGRYLYIPEVTGGARVVNGTVAVFSKSCSILNNTLSNIHHYRASTYVLTLLILLEEITP